MSHLDFIFLKEIESTSNTQKLVGLSMDFWVFPQNLEFLQY